MRQTCPANIYVCVRIRQIERGRPMKTAIVGACVLLMAILVVTPAMAQRGVSGDSGSGRGADSGASSASSVSYSSGSSDSGSYSSSSAVSYSSSAGMGNRGFVSGSPSGPSYTPPLQGSSFYTPRSYYYWNDYYSYLLRYYSFDPLYFGRFIRNSEPLITPAMLKTTISEPLILSRQMLRSIDELDLMLADARAGKSVDKAAIAEKSQQIRDLAKAIRLNRTIALVDIREDTDLLKGEDIDALSPEAIAKLREMALDLNRQLTNLYTTSSSATISVDSFREASFGSVTKGIEKVCKAIENSSKRL
jgi:hypothetical protein